MKQNKKIIQRYLICLLSLVMVFCSNSYGMKNTAIKDYQLEKLCGLNSAYVNAMYAYGVYKKKPNPSTKLQLELQRLSEESQSTSDEIDTELEAQRKYRDHANDLRDTAVKEVLDEAAKTGTLNISDIKWTETYDNKSEFMTLSSSPNTEGCWQSIVEIIEWLIKNNAVKIVNFSNVDFPSLNSQPIFDELILELLDARTDIASIDLSNCCFKTSDLKKLCNVLQNKHVPTKFIIIGNTSKNLAKPIAANLLLSNIQDSKLDESTAKHTSLLASSNSSDAIINKESKILKTVGIMKKNGELLSFDELMKGSNFKKIVEESCNEKQCPEWCDLYEYGETIAKKLFEIVGAKNKDNLTEQELFAVRLVYRMNDDVYDEGQREMRAKNNALKINKKVLEYYDIY